MEFLDYLFDNEYKQRNDIEELKEQSFIVQNSMYTDYKKIEKGTKKTDEEISKLKKRIAELENNLGTMAMFVKTIKKLLEEKGLFNETEFIKLCKKIDLADGIADNKSTLKNQEIIEDKNKKINNKENENDKSFFLNR